MNGRAVNRFNPSGRMTVAGLDTRPYTHAQNCTRALSASLQVAREMHSVRKKRLVAYEISPGVSATKQSDDLHPCTQDPHLQPHATTRSHILVISPAHTATHSSNQPLACGVSLDWEFGQKITTQKSESLICGVCATLTLGPRSTGEFGCTTHQHTSSQLIWC